MGFNKDFRDMMSAGGKISSKRVVTLTAFVLVAIAFTANLGWGVVMDANVLTGMINVVFAGLGVTVGEHLLNFRKGGGSYYGPDNYHDNSNYHEYNNNDSPYNNYDDSSNDRPYNRHKDSSSDKLGDN